MWKKSDSEEQLTEVDAMPAAFAAPEDPSRKAATIGPSITIRGDITGEESLVVDGRVEGTVNLPQYDVTVGADGHIKADVRAKVIEIHGTTEGDLNGAEQVILRRAANVQGNIAAPRVTLEDGCRFKGSIDMEGAVDAGRKSDGSARIAGIKPVGSAGAGGSDKDPTIKPGDSKVVAE